jgi:hypothetical protein
MPMIIGIGTTSFQINRMAVFFLPFLVLLQSGSKRRWGTRRRDPPLSWQARGRGRRLAIGLGGVAVAFGSWQPCDLSSVKRADLWPLTNGLQKAPGAG